MTIKVRCIGESGCGGVGEVIAVTLNFPTVFSYCTVPPLADASSGSQRKRLRASNTNRKSFTVAITLIVYCFTSVEKVFTTLSPAGVLAVTVSDHSPPIVYWMFAVYLPLP